MIELATAVGGRCEFRGCNDYLFEHPLTLEDGNFSEHAHIYPFSDKGPRARDGSAPADLHDIANLMLLCQPCHKLIDSNEAEYPVEALKEMKREHEERIRYLTSFAAENRTHALILKGIVGGRPMELTFDEIREAVAPMYPATRQVFTIDLTGLGDDTSAEYFPAAERMITTRLKEFHDRSVDGTTRGHASVFALASIPLLVLFGRHLSDKIALEFFHRHRDQAKPWRWRAGTQPLSLQIRRVQERSDTRRVGIIVSMSGAIERASLPDDINGDAALYEIVVQGQLPSVRVLNTQADLLHFRQTYAALIARIAAEQPDCRELHFFLATPPPCAIVCGFERLPKVQPTLFLYDNLQEPNSDRRTFKLRLTTR